MYLYFHFMSPRKRKSVRRALGTFPRFTPSSPTGPDVHGFFKSKASHQPWPLPFVSHVWPVWSLSKCCGSSLFLKEPFDLRSFRFTEKLPSSCREFLRKYPRNPLVSPDVSMHITVAHLSQLMNHVPEVHTCFCFLSFYPMSCSLSRIPSRTPRYISCKSLGSLWLWQHSQFPCFW